MNLIAYLCQLLDCDEFELVSRLRIQSNRVLVEKSLAGKTLYTLYSDKPHEVVFHGLSIGDSRTTKAYNGYLDITVQQHFYVRHRNKLSYPLLPLVVHIQKNSSHRSFYPMELLIITV